jgi:hypothetical protein
MIIVTGVGRTGTTLIACLYRELGFDPGGYWQPEIEAGLEEPAVVRANRAIASDLGLGLPVDPDLVSRRLVRLPGGIEAREIAQPAPPPGASTARRLGRLLPARLRHGLRNAAASIAARARTRRRGSLLYRNRRPRAVDWTRFEQVVERNRSTIHALAQAHPVVKDPRFCWTLGVWAAAGAPIDHVLICTRSTAASVESRMRAGHFDRRARDGENSLIYGLGLCLSQVFEYRLAHAIVRFPDFLNDADALYEAMRFPSPVDRERFGDALARVIAPERVHDWR